MAFTILQAGTVLQFMDTNFALTTLTLPTNVTLDATKVPRFTIYGRYVVMVNSPSRPITIDATGTVRVLTPAAPRTQLTLSAQAGGTLTGTYLALQTFIIKDLDGNIIAESDYGPVQSAGVAVANQFLRVAGLDISPDAIWGSRLYRTTTNGSTYFEWLDADGNTQTYVQDDLSDLALQLVASPILGSAPDLTLVAEWRERLWGVARGAIDHLRYTEAGLMYAWPLDNDLPVPHVGSDARGVTSLIARREVLGIGRRNILQQVTGNNNEDFAIVKLSENVGVESHESMKVYRDIATFLWKDGVYQWDQSGVKCISDGPNAKGRVRSWFTTNSYFNAAKFPNAFAQIIPSRNVYRLFLASAGSTTIDRFVDYDMTDQTWWGPHKTSALTPSCAFIMSDANDTFVPLVGSSSGYVWQEQSTRTDSSLTPAAIDFDTDTKFMDANTPTVLKQWGSLVMVGKPQASGTLTITPKVGYLNAAAQVPMLYDMTQGHQNLRRLGVGEMTQLNLRNNAAGVDVELYGLELDYAELARR